MPPTRADARTDPATSPAATGLPERPVLRDDHPLLWRGDDCLQVGDDGRRVVVHGVDTDLARWARGLDGLRRLDEAVGDAEVSGVGSARAARLLRALAAAGALDDATVTADALRTSDPATRARLAPDLAAAAHAYGDPRAAAAAIDGRAAARVRVLGTGRVADAVAAALRAAGVRVLAVPHPDADDAGATASTLDVLADAPHPDVPDDHGALAADRPHLPVVVRGRLARIGPLVLPGQSSCLRCADLHRADRDPAWPRLAVQLAHRRPGTLPVDAALALAAGAWAALAVLAHAEAGAVATSVPTAGAARTAPTARPTGGGPGRGGAGPDRAVELTLPGGAPSVASFPPHPLCGCRWSVAA